MSPTVEMWILGLEFTASGSAASALTGEVITGSLVPKQGASYSNCQKEPRVCFNIRHTEFTFVCAWQPPKLKLDSACQGPEQISFTCRSVFIPV